jgi:hypothetical protein
MRKLKAVKLILVEFSVYGMERLLQCQQAGTGGNNLRDRRGRLTRRIIAPGGDWRVEAERSVQDVEP